MRHTKGFTLVELVMVIVILGILAAVAIPRYINIQSRARFAAINSLAGGVNAAVSTVQGQYNAAGNLTATTATMQDGTSVTVAAGTGIPVKATGGIDNAIKYTGFTYDAAAGRFDFSPVVTNCFVTYTESTGVATATTTGCPNS